MFKFLGVMPDCRTRSKCVTCVELLHTSTPEGYLEAHNHYGYVCSISLLKSYTRLMAAVEVWPDLKRLSVAHKKSASVPARFPTCLRRHRGPHRLLPAPCELPQTLPSKGLLEHPRQTHGSCSHQTQPEATDRATKGQTDTRNTVLEILLLLK